LKRQGPEWRSDRLTRDDLHRQRNLSAAASTVGRMTERLPIPEASAHLDELVARARTIGEPVILTEDDAPVAAIIDIDILRELQQAQDDADIAVCTRSEADPAPRLTHEEFMAILDAEDAAAS
jgi:prevent-host-death family protein